MTTLIKIAFTTLMFAVVGCGKLAPATAGLGDACTRNADCAAPYVCGDGRCIVDAGRMCEPDATRCNGDAVERCAPGGDGWDLETTCATGCSAGACRPFVCTAGDRKCEGGAVFACLSNGAGWAFDHSCPTACDAANKTCAEPVCTPFDTRCVSSDSGRIETCNERGTAWEASDCRIGDVAGVCDEGRCLPKICVPGEAGGRCEGDVRQRCNASGSGYESLEICSFGCSQGPGAAPACAAAACVSGATRCVEGAIEKCTPDRRSFAFFQYCVAGCAESGGQATCLAPACQPLARLCATDPTTNAPIVRACKADGSGFVPVEACAQSCAQGTCVASDDQCVPGATRCRGVEAEVCVRLTDGTNHWTFVERCLGTCSGGACDRAGACGCSGSSTEACGSATRPPVTLNALLPAATAPSADGYSTFLLYTEPVTDTAGVVVPDGSLVTFATDGSDPLLASPDADAATPGLQRPTFRGRARVLLRAPSSPRDVRVSASMGGSCSGSLLLTFAATTSPGHVAWHAEDFSTTRLYDRLNTNALWDSSRAMAAATPAWSLGTASDGDLSVAPASVRDLYDEGLAKAWTVLSLGRDRAQVDASFLALAPGDEVLVINLASTSGGPSAIGVYEFKRVLRVEAGVVVFTEPLANELAPNGNGDLTGQKLFLQRVPHFNNVTVEAGGTLTVRSYANGGTGVLAMRARGTVRVLGSLTVAERGLPASTAQPGTTSTALPRWLLGAGQSKPGGGILFVAGKTVTVRNEAGAVQGTISASSSGGGGGTIWLQGPTVQVGTASVVASGTAADGRVRLDYGAIDAGSTTRPSAYQGQTGSAYVQSLTAYTEPSAALGAQAAVRAASLVGVVGGVGRTSVGLPAQVSGVRMEVGFDTGAFQSIDAARALSSAAGARTLRWRARLDPPGDEAVELLGIAIKVEAW